MHIARCRLELPESWFPIMAEEIWIPCRQLPYQMLCLRWLTKSQVAYPCSWTAVSVAGSGRAQGAERCGADAVLIGRPYLYGLGAEGEAGVTKVINILQREFAMAMALTGRTTIASIDRSVIWRTKIGISPLFQRDISGLSEEDHEIPETRPHWF